MYQYLAHVCIEEKEYDQAKKYGCKN